MKKNRWKIPIEKTWWSIIADGNLIAVMEQSKKFNKERKRLANLGGIEIRVAEYHELIRKKAKTQLPENILYQMELAAKEKDYVKNYTIPW